jgi:hypothetical protein
MDEVRSGLTPRFRFRVIGELIVVVQTWFNSEQIRADLSEPEPL